MVSWPPLSWMRDRSACGSLRDGANLTGEAAQGGRRETPSPPRRGSFARPAQSRIPPRWLRETPRGSFRAARRMRHAGRDGR